MPLPANWRDLFYDDETGDDLIIGLTAREYAGIAECNELDPAMLLAAASLYLTVIGRLDQAEEYFAYSEKIWPELPWQQIREHVSRCAAGVQSPNNVQSRMMLPSLFEKAVAGLLP